MSAVADLGEAPAVVLLADDPDMWTGLAMLLGSYMRVIVAEADGFAPPEDLGSFAVVGHGDAGATAQRLAAEGDVEALVLLDSVTSETQPELAAAESRIAEREIPVFLIWGEDDEVVPAEQAERLADRVPRATLALLPGRSHRALEEAPEAVAPLVLEYLRSRYLGERHGHAEPDGPMPIALTRRPDPS